MGIMKPDEKPPAASEEDIAKRVGPRMKELQDAIAYVAFRGSVLRSAALSQKRKGQLTERKSAPNNHIGKP